MLAARRKGWAPAGGKRLLRYFSVVALLLVGFRFGHAIVDDADRGSEDGGAKPDDMGGRRRDLDLQTVDPPGSSSSRGVVALEGDSSIDTQSDDDDYGNNSQDLSLCLLLIVRDEETSMRINLPLWRDVAHCYVIGVDDRTTDGTVQAIHDALEEDTPRYDDVLRLIDVCARRASVCACVHRLGSLLLYYCCCSRASLPWCCLSRAYPSGRFE